MPPTSVPLSVVSRLMGRAKVRLRTDKKSGSLDGMSDAFFRERYWDGYLDALRDVGDGSSEPRANVW